MGGGEKKAGEAETTTTKDRGQGKDRNRKGKGQGAGRRGQDIKCMKETSRRPTRGNN